MRAPPLVRGNARAPSPLPPLPGGEGNLRRSLVALALLCLTTTACGGDAQTLEGSLSELLDLRYRKVSVVQTQEELSVRFVWPEGASEDVVLRVTSSLLGAVVNPRQPLDLAEVDDLGRVRGRVARAVNNDPVTDFPPPRRGALTFDRHLQQGATVNGELHLTFENGTELASGRTVFGSFEATIE